MVHDARDCRSMPTCCHLRRKRRWSRRGRTRPSPRSPASSQVSPSTKIVQGHLSGTLLLRTDQLHIPRRSAFEGARSSSARRNRKQRFLQWSIVLRGTEYRTQKRSRHCTSRARRCHTTSGPQPAGASQWGSGDRMKIHSSVDTSRQCRERTIAGPRWR